MIFGKLWNSIAAQFNKLANAIRGYDPIAEMQLEYDRSVAQLKEGREGLAQYRALVERVQRQVDNQTKVVATLEAAEALSTVPSLVASLDRIASRFKCYLALGPINLVQQGRLPAVHISLIGVPGRPSRQGL